MKVIRSRKLGYCHGVAETLKKADLCIQKGLTENRPFYSIGKLIHNGDVVRTFESRGLKVIDKPDTEKGFALVRAHGIPDRLRSDFLNSGFELIDATCVNIQHSKKEILKAWSDGRSVVVIGVKNHAETDCLLGSKDVPCFLVSCEDDLKGLFSSVSSGVPVTVVTQTTFLQTDYEKLSGKIKEHYKDCVFANRLCLECLIRKDCVSEIAPSCDVFVVVGGKHSENTKDLVKYCETFGKPVWHVENIDDFSSELDKEIVRFDSVGICSGTSTPMQIIDKVCEHLSTLERKS